MPKPDTAAPLPDRPIYHKPSLLAYFGSFWVHSWDESAAFWEKNRKQIVVPIALLALTVYVWALIRGWEYAVNEVLLGAIVTVGVPLSVSGLLYLWGVIKAPLQIHRRLITVERHHTMSAVPLRSKALRLAEEIGQFVAMCRATRPKGGMIPYDEAAHWTSVAENAKAAHSSETGKLYYERFAKRVMDLRDELSLAGIVDDQLDAVYLNPTSDNDMATVGQRFRALADRLPMGGGDVMLPSHEIAFRQLRDENSSLRNEVADLKARTQQRRLDDEASKVLASRLQAGLVGLKQQMIEASWEPEDIERRMLVKLVAVGTDRETVAYRLDLKKAFEAGGFDVLLGDRAAGNAQDEDLVGVVSVVRGKPDSPIIPCIVDALRNAGVTTREVEGLPYGRWLHEQLKNDPMQNLVAIVVVGPRE